MHVDPLSTTGQLSDDGIDEELAGHDVDPATVPATVRRPVALAAQLANGILTRAGWGSTPLLVMTLWARRNPLGAPDPNDVICQPKVVEPEDGTINAIIALRNLMARERPRAPDGRMFYGFAVTAELLSVEEDVLDAADPAEVWNDRTPAENAELFADLVAAGRGRQTLVVVGSLADGWRFEYRRPRHGDLKIAVFAPGEPWHDQHEFADAVIEATRVMTSS